MRNGEGLSDCPLRRFHNHRSAHIAWLFGTYRSDIGVYLINALMPTDGRIGLCQSRDTLQNEFKMEYKVN
jgi:hypothetical protein